MNLTTETFGLIDQLQYSYIGNNSEQGPSGLPCLVQENHYYPFGMNMSGLTTGDSKYRFGGKEFQDDLNLMWYDFSARNYDAQLGRWFNIDPMAEKYSSYSPYNYCQNNPAYFIDPSGKDPNIYTGVAAQVAFAQVLYYFNHSGKIFELSMATAADVSSGGGSAYQSGGKYTPILYSNQSEGL